MNADKLALGVDLGGTKIEVALVDADGKIQERLKQRTTAEGGAEGVVVEIAEMVRRMREKTAAAPLGVGVGVAGQVAADSGVVRFAPNLQWHNFPLQEKLHQALELPVVVTNDVRAATWGEWLHGAGQGTDDLICIFIGTGLGGGLVSGGRMLHGCSNTAGELGHTTVLLNGPPCTCGHRGCLEAMVAGWAIARDARKAIKSRPAAGQTLLRIASELKQAPATVDEVTAEAVSLAAKAGDPLARNLLDEVVEALVAGVVTFVNAFNPCRLILGGGVVEGFPDLLTRLEAGVRETALEAAQERLQFLQAELHNEAGVIGAAALARQTFVK